MEYFSFKKAKKSHGKSPKAATPVLADEDEAFLKRITAQVEGTPPALPERPQDLKVAGDTEGNDMQLVIANEARQVPLPDAPDTPRGLQPETDAPTAAEANGADKGKETEKSKDGKKDRWSFLRRGSKAIRRKSSSGEGSGSKAGKQKATDANTGEGEVGKAEVQKEEDEMAAVLDQLNLAAVNNRAFSLSAESQELLKKFTLVFKDLVNGVPTAYHDLESLLTNSEDTLQKMFKGMPSFIQDLVAKLPEKFTSHLGPEAVAMAAEKVKMSGSAAAAAGGPAIKLKVPSLKELVMKRGALVGMLRSIVSVLKTRFPAVLGVNMLWSLALFLLLLICWYCHKRGREVRLEKERQLTEAEMQALRDEVAADAPGEYSGPMTTTAPDGATMEEVRAGIVPADEVRDGDGPATYAEGGSLAQAMREEEEEQKAGEHTDAAGSAEQTPHRKPAPDHSPAAP